ncbi:MAG: hypothetical protein PHR77_00880 [Kiritimatiellae bacterium]|nr:hypothetical protein [Kiritimatiellia bacterium]MDD5522495.1 hypothetical protein [Kiritimatiellia bacterium]
MITLFILAVYPCFASPDTEKNAWVSSISPVIIDYFYEAGCVDCTRVKNQIMPELKERLEGYFKINNYDVGIKTNVIRLAAYQEKLNIVSNKPVMMVVDYKYVFNGFDAIKAGLLRQMDECIAAQQEPGWKPPQPIEIKDNDIVVERMKRFTASVVVTAGFLDGLNPCAIATMVFFMSLLVVARIRGRGLLLMGFSFCMASFITYTALGLGLLRTLHLFSGFSLVRHIVDTGIIIILTIFAFISFRDAYRYKMTGNPDDVTLQLPESIKLKIHGILKKGISKKSLIAGGTVTGILVTALESVCTGQMYVPTLVIMAKSGMSKAWGYLLLYNLMFILPLVIIFVLTYFGLQTQTLLDWSKKNIVISKVLIGFTFVLLVFFVWIF